MSPRPQSCIMMVFGATGDLAKRKLFPSLYHLDLRGLLPEHFAVVGNSRKPMTSEAFRDLLRDEEIEFLGEKPNPEAWNRFLQRFHYVAGDANDPETFEALKKVLTKLDEELQAGSRFLFYLATADDFFFPIVQQLDKVGLARQSKEAWRRFVFEKPFGRDLASAKKLNSDLSSRLSEDQIYRIDHYLGKETVQNIMVMRFANGIFEPIWNRNFIESVDITVAETVGVEDRGGYYDHSGAMRDMVPNHLFQLLAFIGMEPPASFDADAVRTEKTKVLKSIRPMSKEEILRSTIRGQYGAGEVQGKPVVGYRQEKKVSPQSNTETFVALKLWVDNWRWSGVPFNLRTGKRLARRLSEIRIQFKCPPLELFRNTQASCLDCNQLVLQIQPQERVTLHFGAKIPGTGLQIGCVGMNFDYADTFGKVFSTGYETLIYDCMNGDGTLFQRADQIESAWEVVTPILEVWESNVPEGFPNYPAGSWGPLGAEFGRLPGQEK